MIRNVNYKTNLEKVFLGYVESMNEILLLKTLIITSSFHTEHNKAPEFSRNSSIDATMWLLQHSLFSSLSLSLSLSVFVLGVVVVEGYQENVDSRWTQNFFVRKNRVNIQSCSYVKFHHTNHLVSYKNL